MPESLLAADGRPRFGAFRGAPERFDYAGLAAPYGRNRVDAFLRHKRWMYFFVATDEVIIATAVVDAGPTGTTFVMVTDRATGEILADASRPGAVGMLSGVCDRPTSGHRAHYVMPGTFATLRGDESELQLRATYQRLPSLPVLHDPWIELDVRLATDVHPGLTVVAEMQCGRPLVSATSKNAGLPSRGQLTLRHDGLTSEYDLSQGFGGFDYTNGFLPRHTSWRWAFLTGMLADGRSLGLNLVSDFSGIEDRADENACWLNGTLYRLDPAARITVDKSDVMKPWHVFTADRGVDLEFTPLALHREGLNLGVIRSRFIQPTGHFSGTITVAGEELHVDALPGVVEDQDVLW